jgi:hypothetical protein
VVKVNTISLTFHNPWAHPACNYRDWGNTARGLSNSDTRLRKLLPSFILITHLSKISSSVILSALSLSLLQNSCVSHSQLDVNKIHGFLEKGIGNSVMSVYWNNCQYNTIKF